MGRQRCQGDTGWRTRAIARLQHKQSSCRNAGKLPAGGLGCCGWQWKMMLRDIWRAPALRHRKILGFQARRSRTPGGQLKGPQHAYGCICKFPIYVSVDKPIIPCLGVTFELAQSWLGHRFHCPMATCQLSLLLYCLSQKYLIRSASAQTAYSQTELVPDSSRFASFL
jgi:hypothetical protein